MIVMGGIFGVAGYLIAPQPAGSAPIEAEKVKDLHKTLGQAQAERTALQNRLQNAEAELAKVRESAQAAEKELQSYRDRAESSEKALADATARVEAQKEQVQPLQEKLAAAERAAAEAKTSNEQARQQAETLSSELAAARGDVSRLNQQAEGLQSANAELKASLKDQQAASAEIRRFLPLLEMGPAVAAASARSPGEMPITGKELLDCFGTPAISSVKGRDFQARWAEGRSASITDGIVAEINGQDATRAILASVTPRPPAVAPAPGAWRAGKGERLHYADLVSMFGRPERVAGTASEFTAWWTIGAWARPANATIAEGVVTRFDGRPADPAACCELVRHRAQAYNTVTPAVRSEVAAAEEFYRRASGIAGAALSRDTASRPSDGAVLSAWKLAPLDSVATWIARTGPAGEAMTLRAAVDCTWTALDGRQTTRRRFVVLTVPQAGKDASECVFFAGRD